MLPDFRYTFEVAGKDRTDNCISGHFQPRHKSKSYGHNYSWPIGKSIYSEHLTSTTVDQMGRWCIILIPGCLNDFVRGQQLAYLHNSTEDHTKRFLENIDVGGNSI